MFKRMMHYLFPKMLWLETQQLQAREELVQAAMKVERRAADVRQELSRLTLEPIAKG